MAKIKGICRNEECDLCIEQKIQEAEKSNFVCESCGKPLIPFGNGGGNKGNKKRNIIIAAIAAVVVAIIAIMLCVIGSKPKNIILNHTQMELKVGETDELKVANLADGDVAVYKASKNKVVSVNQNGVVTALKGG